MNDPIHLVHVGKQILEQDECQAAMIRLVLQDAACCGINVLGSPGCGKTSVILAPARILSERQGLSAAVIEGDVDSVVDAEMVRNAGLPVGKINTGGMCHLNAAMVAAHRLHPSQYVVITLVGSSGSGKRFSALAVPGVRLSGDPGFHRQARAHHPCGVRHHNR